MGSTSLGLFYVWCMLLMQYCNCESVKLDDSVTVEAIPSDRAIRQIIYSATPISNIPALIIETDNAVSQNPCFTDKGVLGRCMSFRQCYPYFKLTEVNNYDSWIYGVQQTCSYYTAQGRQMFGVCCVEIQKPPEEELSELPIAENNTNGSEAIGIVKIPVFNNWPPPLPTHPPHHTIPPLPTHPPSPGFPGLPTVPGIATQKPAWPPSTTRPPWQLPASPSTPPPNDPIIPIASCGAKNGFQDQERIVGGHNADLNEWPWIAALFNGGRQFCGGSLIDDVHILSAAHCVAHMSSWDVARLTVRLGDHNIRTNTDTQHVEKKVKKIVRHRGFDPRTLYNDIAILTLDTPVAFTKEIRPICLPAGSTGHPGQTATVIGWGSLRESGPQPSVLQEVNIPIWSNSECRAKYGHAAPGGIVDHMLCAGQANKDSCSGDSGGPLMINDGKWKQAGIVSWGIGCGKGQYPGVYTRVEKFIPWINKNLK
ncbi:Trypsin [Oryctes borbonicus]|uniref:Phenoloxidase-activating factor 2 n=1 Tax=Oryctes borbonicus TaxID=1629725 RepID=A0A0T6AU30_9SCAR|nr:Trypsin [Oryctes borbonicus]